MPTSIAIDIGGTFTDLVVNDSAGLRIYKVPSTPADPAAAVLQALDGAGIAAWDWFVHGSTVATNAILERKGARTGFLATEGFRDLLEIGRQTRLDLYSLTPRKHRPLVPRDLCFEVRERVDRHGTVLVPLDLAGLDRALDSLVAAGAESLAVCFLFSFARPEHERIAGERARERGLHVSLSSDILPEYREYERASTTAANAYVAPVVSRYLARLVESLQTSPDSPSRRPLPRIMQSNGGIISLETARREAVRTVLSGPAGGVVGARGVAAPAGEGRIIAFDMGGTSTDVALVEGAPQTCGDAAIDHLPIRVPMLDIVTVGAGGGSIARVDRGGVLRVGPESAGADPGPAAYGRGSLPTVTDANLVLGRLHAPSFLGGRMRIDVDRSRAAVAALGRELGLSPEAAAAGIVRVVNAEMARAVRRISVERGHDPRDFCLVAFGGSGPLHAGELAGEVGTPRVLVPRFPGALSALGMLLSDVRKERSATLLLPTGELTAALLGERFDALEAAGRSDLAAEAIAAERMALERWAEMRYRGQSYELAVPAGPEPGEDLASWPLRLAARFHDRHRQAYGYASEGEATEIVALRVAAVGQVEKPQLPRAAVSPAAPPPAAGELPGPGGSPYPRHDRASLVPGQAVTGPAVLTQEDATTFVPTGWVAAADEWYNVLLTRTMPPDAH